MRYLFIFLIACNPKEPVNVKPVANAISPYVPSPAVKQAQDNVYLMIRLMTIKDSFYFKGLEHEIKNEPIQLKKRCMDSVALYRKKIDSIRELFNNRPAAVTANE